MFQSFSRSACDLVDNIPYTTPPLESVIREWDTNPMKPKRTRIRVCSMNSSVGSPYSGEADTVIRGKNGVLIAWIRMRDGLNVVTQQDVICDWGTFRLKVGTFLKHSLESGTWQSLWELSAELLLLELICPSNLSLWYLTKRSGLVLQLRLNKSAAAHIQRYVWAYGYVAA